MLNTNNIKINTPYKYKELCDLLGDKEKTRSRRDKQFQQWTNLFVFHTEGTTKNKVYIIDEIFTKEEQQLNVEEYNTLKESNVKLCGDIILHLIAQKNNVENYKYKNGRPKKFKTLIIDKNKLYQVLGLCTEDYFDISNETIIDDKIKNNACDYTTDFLKDLEIEKKYKIYYGDTNKKLNYLLMLDKNISDNFYSFANNTVLNTLTSLDKKGKIIFELKNFVNGYELSDNQEEKYKKIVKDVLSSLKNKNNKSPKSVKQAYEWRMGKEYRKRLLPILKEQIGINSIPIKKYIITFIGKEIHQLSSYEFEEHRKELNNRTQNYIIHKSKEYYDRYINQMEAYKKFKSDIKNKNLEKIIGFSVNDIPICPTVDLQEEYMNDIKNRLKLTLSIDNINYYSFLNQIAIINEESINKKISVEEINDNIINKIVV